MSFQATIDIFVNFSSIQVRFLNRQGFIRYRLKIYMKIQNEYLECHPYNIVKRPTKSQSQSTTEQRQNVESEIDNDMLYYYSRLIPVLFRPGIYQQNQTVFFKAYVNTQIIDDVEFYCVIECLFTEDPQVKPQIVGKFEARLRKFYNISTFLPAVFDAFEGFMIIYISFDYSIIQI